MGAGIFTTGLDLPVGGGRDGGAIDEDFPRSFRQQRIPARGKETKLSGIVSHYSEDDLRGGRYGSECIRCFRLQLGSEPLGDITPDIIDRSDRKTLRFKAADHVGSHAAEANESDGFIPVHFESFAGMEAAFLKGFCNQRSKALAFCRGANLVPTGGYCSRVVLLPVMKIIQRLKKLLTTGFCTP